MIQVCADTQNDLVIRCSHMHWGLISHDNSNFAIRIPFQLFKIFLSYQLAWTNSVFVRLSLLTMTNPNQLCDVLLFVCSKMADETNLSSKLPVANRTREVWGRKLCWWCLSSGFPLCTFLLGFADSFCIVFTSSLFMRPRHFVRSCAICSHDSVGGVWSGSTPFVIHPAVLTHF